MMTLNDLAKYKNSRIHFIAIGGCSMSGLAMILKSLGFHVTGSDKNESTFTRNLQNAGISFTIGHDAANIPGAGLVVYNAAIKPGNPEYDKAVELGVDMMDRATLLGLISREYERVVCVSGCHGKTTITSMIALILMRAGVDPTVHVGGMIDFLHGGVAIGGSDILVTEACEYVESFLKLKPSHIVINNIDDDHLDYYKDIEHINSAFVKFVSMLPEGGTLFACISDPRVKAIANSCGKRVITYSIDDKSANVTAQGVEYDSLGNPSYDFKMGGKLARVKLNVLGRHNVQNSLAAIAVCHLVFGVSLEDSARYLAEYRLADRRFEYMGEKRGYKIFHDYAHHPSEIAACLEAADKYPHKKLWAVFQCNSFTRARSLKNKYASCFTHADTVIVPDIYPGRDKDTGDIHARDLVELIKKHSDAVYVPTFEEIDGYLAEHAGIGDLVLTIGSGSVYRETQKLL